MSRKKDKFLCGVVEGFYGRPWTMEQRFDLFSHMSTWGMNSYLYAPKDDEKHRAYWRDLYSLEEAAELSELIKETSSKGVQFIYAISPGLDISFSSEQEVDLLKKKLDQVSALGCRSFAILFDDIDSEMLVVDAKEFPSFSHAQVAITNDVYEHLGKPETFLFCPTEYCGSRAEPSVGESQYLKHIGKHLHPDIDVMWTGPKVISKVILESSVDELSEVILRPPVIWDNIHANDYDQRRLFLGPYVGRSVELIPKLNGVLTNPNCEYGANYVPIHTLGQWSQCGKTMSQKSSSIKQSILLEVEGSDPTKGEGEESGGLCLYDPQKALDVSLNEWFMEFQIPRKKPEHYRPVKSTVSVSRATELTMTSAMELESLHTEAESSKMELDPSKTETESSKMDFSLPPVADEAMHVSTSLPSISPASPSSSPVEQFTLEDLRLLVDYFYLPHKHGSRALHVLEEFCWLKERAPGYEVLRNHGCLKGHKGKDMKPLPPAGEGVVSSGMRSDGETSESITEEDMTDYDVATWCSKAESFHRLCSQVNDMHTRLTAVPNRTLLYDLYQYVWDAKETTMLLDTYISWLEAGGSEVNPNHEPHCPRGGITAEMQSLLPHVKDSPKSCRGPSPPSSPVFVVRPFREEDKPMLYKTCLETGDSGNDAGHLYTNYPDLLGDRFVGPYLEFCGPLCYVLEDSVGVCGYVLAALNSDTFYHKFREDWLPGLLQHYPLPPPSTPPSPEVDLLHDLHHFEFVVLPAELAGKFPSHLHIDLMKRAQGQGVGVRMIHTILTQLRQRGSCGVHLEMSAYNSRANRFYRKLGFKELTFPKLPADVIVLGKTLQ